MKGSSSLTSCCLLILSRLLSSLILVQLTLLAPALGIRSPLPQNGAPIHRVRAHSLTGIRNTHLSLLFWCGRCKLGWNEGKAASQAESFATTTWPPHPLLQAGHHHPPAVSHATLWGSTRGVDVSGWGHVLHEACGGIEKLSFIPKITLPTPASASVPSCQPGWWKASKRWQVHDRRRREAGATSRYIRSQPCPLQPLVTLEEEAACTSGSNHWGGWHCHPSISCHEHLSRSHFNVHTARPPRNGQNLWLKLSEQVKGLLLLPKGEGSHSLMAVIRRYQSVTPPSMTNIHQHWCPVHCPQLCRGPMWWCNLHQNCLWWLRLCCSSPWFCHLWQLPWSHTLSYPPRVICRFCFEASHEVKNCKS